MIINRLNRNRSISRILVVAIALVLVASLFCGGAVALNWASYDGSQSGDITIDDTSGSTLNHKATLTISQNAVLDFGNAKTYVLTGSTSTSGCGGLVDNLVFSDASKTLTIKNLHITGSGAITSTSYGIGGLFGRIINTNGTLILENCSINGVTITGTSTSSTCVGGLVGYAEYMSLNIEMKNCTIENCNISTCGIDCVGGLIGLMRCISLNMSGCMVTFSNVTPSNTHVGGLIGSADSGNLNMSGCIVDRIYVKGSNNVGGLIGNLGINGVAVNCANTIVNGSEIKSSGTYVGGLVGVADSASLNLTGCLVENCTVWSSSVSDVGGLVGRADHMSIGFIGDGCWVNNSWVSGMSSIGSLMGYSYNTSMTTLVTPQHSAVYSASTTTGSTAIANNDFDGIGTKEQYGSPIDRYGLVAGKDYGYISSTPSVVASGTCGANLTWVLTNDGTLTISGTGTMTDYTWDSSNESSTAPWYQYSSQMTKLILSDGLTTIGTSAFSGCSNFTGSLILPNNLTTIGHGAFYRCSGFTGSLTIPDSVMTIKDSAFSCCNNFTGFLNLSKNLKTIGNHSFAVCNGFTGSLIIPNNVTSIGDFAFWCCRGFTGSLTIGNSTKTIGTGAFCDCSGFTGSLTIGNNVTTIGDSAFYSCSGITNLTIPSSVQTIENYSFDECRGLSNVTISNGVISIGLGAFAHCSGLTHITIPSSITTIGDMAFGKCSNLTIISVDDNNQNYSSDEHGILYNKAKTLLICSPAGISGSINISTNVTTIGNQAFYECSGITNVTIPSSVTSIGSDAFDYLHPNSVIYAECSASLVSGNYSEDRTALAAKGTNNAYTFTVDSTFFPSGFSLTSDNAPVKENATFAGWYTTSSYSGNTVSTVTDGQTLYAKWSNSSSIIASGTCGTNLTWALTNDGTLTISGTGAMDDYLYGTAPWYSYRSNMTKLVLPNELTTIGDYAFYDCSNFTESLTLPNSHNLTKIGDYAFYGCSGFTNTLEIPAAASWEGSYWLVKNTSIGNYAFANCSGLTQITISGSIMPLGTGAFENLHQNSIIYASGALDVTHFDYDSLFVSYTKSLTSCALFDGDYKYCLFRVDSTAFPSGFPLTNDNAPIKTNATFEGWYEKPFDVSTKVTSANNESRLFANFTGGIYAVADQSSIYHGNKFNITGINDLGGTLHFFIKGTNCPLSVYGNTTTHLEYAVANGSFWNVTLEIDIDHIPKASTPGGYFVYIAKTHDVSVDYWNITNTDDFDNTSLFDAYDCVHVASMQPTLTTNITSNIILHGDNLEITGIAEGNTSLVNIYVFGTNFFRYANASVNVNNNHSYSFTKKVIPWDSDNPTEPDGTWQMAPGQYFVVVQHPMCDKEFNVAPDGNNWGANIYYDKYVGWRNGMTNSLAPHGSIIFNTATKQSSNAAQILADMIMNNNIDDIQVNFTFIVSSQGFKLYPGWNVVSVPQKPSSGYDTIGELFNDVDTANHPIYTYDNEKKVWNPALSSTSITPLNAYWIYSATAKTIRADLNSASLSTVSKPVYSGWNVVGIATSNSSITAATAFSSVDWQEYHEWNASTQSYNPTLVKGGSGTAADTNKVSIWNGGWLSLNTNGTYTGSA